MISTPFDYNTQRARLIIPEYGRHVQRMVEHCMEIDERDKRTYCAKSIIQVIARLNPQLRNSDNFERTLWDHLYVMSEFKLDVDGPFPKPTAEELESKPKRVEYPQTKIQFGHYGKIVERMVEQCAAMEEGETRAAYTELIANHMKKQFLTYNRDTVPDLVILKDLNELSKGKLKLKKDVQLTATADIIRGQQNGPKNEVETTRKRQFNRNKGNSSGAGKKRNRNRKKRY